MEQAAVRVTPEVNHGADSVHMAGVATPPMAGHVHLLVVSGQARGEVVGGDVQVGLLTGVVDCRRGARVARGQVLMVVNKVLVVAQVLSGTALIYAAALVVPIYHLLREVEKAPPPVCFTRVPTRPP